MTIQQQLATLDTLLIQEKELQHKQLVCLTNLHRLLVEDLTAGHSKLGSRQLAALGNLIEDLWVGLTAKVTSRVSLAVAFSAALAMVDSFNIEH
jgi:hypothetical protein